MAKPTISKSIHQLRDLPEKKWLDLVDKNDVYVTYGGKRVAQLKKYAEATPTPKPDPGTGDTDTPTLPTPGPSTDLVPADILNLRNWTLMLPTGSPGDPDNVYPKHDSIPGVFFVRQYGVVLRTPVTGVHSPNSKYPRTELREMKDDKWGKAAWSNASGTHTLTARLSVDHNLVVKPEVSMLQIHDGSDDVMQVRIGAGNKLEVSWNDGDSKATLDEAYKLGSTHDFKVVAAGKKIEVYYDGQLKATIPKSGSGWYFKAGNYLQSRPEAGEAATAWSEVTLYSLDVTHS